MAKISILGCGFGTALSVLWDKAGHEVTAWTKFDEEIKAIEKEHEHKKLLPGVKIPESVKFTTDISVIADSDIVVFAVPSFAAAETTERAKDYLRKETILVSVGKGFVKDTDKLISEVICEKFPQNDLVVLTGPCHAEEIGRGVPTTIVSAGKNKNAAKYIQDTLQTETLRIYLSDDPRGCELGGALKNPIALCCGIVEGMGLGDNTLAALMTRGIAEITRLGVALGANWQTFTGLAGVGDLIVTCTSVHSRNHRAGLLIGKGMSAEDAIKETGTVEGYACAKVALMLAKKHNIQTPIIEQLCAVCYDNMKPETALKNLMSRPLRHEKEFFWGGTYG